MPCTLCNRSGHNSSTCPRFLLAQHNVHVQRENLLNAEGELANIAQLIDQQVSRKKAANSMWEASAAKKKKSGEEGVSPSKGSDTEKELFGDDPCSFHSEKDVPCEKIDAPGGK